jgi:hypothetical protein
MVRGFAWRSAGHGIVFYKLKGIARQGSTNKNAPQAMQENKYMTNSQKTDGKQADGKFAPGNSIGKKFPSGSSGNPNGRPKLTRLTEALREQLAEAMPGADESTIAESLARALIREGLSGDVQAIREIADRTEGKPKQAIDLDLQVSDWKVLAKNYGIPTSDIIAEAQLLIAEFIDGSSDE